jgi:hypothetical protein
MSQGVTIAAAVAVFGAVVIAGSLRGAVRTDSRPEAGADRPIAVLEV